jgi:hypothetical protein
LVHSVDIRVQGDKSHAQLMLDVDVQENAIGFDRDRIPHWNSQFAYVAGSRGLTSFGQQSVSIIAIDARTAARARRRAGR